jgi:hypothetical protein
MEESEETIGFWQRIIFPFKRIPPSFVAALLVAVPFIAVDAFNYYSAGTALVLSLPVLAILYVVCGVLSGKLYAQRGGSSSGMLMTGAIAGVSLWIISTTINTLLGLAVGTLTLGMTLLRVCFI